MRKSTHFSTEKNRYLQAQNKHMLHIGIYGQRQQPTRTMFRTVPSKLATRMGSTTNSLINGGFNQGYGNHVSHPIQEYREDTALASSEKFHKARGWFSPYTMKPYVCGRFE
jgi:hypothetical protein